jgi:hypothetical protein
MSEIGDQSLAIVGIRFIQPRTFCEGCVYVDCIPGRGMGGAGVDKVVNGNV